MKKIIKLNIICFIAFSVFSYFSCIPGDRIAVVTTTEISNVTGTSALGGGNVTQDGGEMVSERGVCWSTNVYPNLANNKTSDGSGKGSFSSHLSGLLPGTTYHVRAYAINDYGTAYGSDVSFTTNQ